MGDNGYSAEPAAVPSRWDNIKTAFTRWLGTSWVRKDNK